MSQVKELPIRQAEEAAVTFHNNLASANWNVVSVTKNPKYARVERTNDETENKNVKAFTCNLGILSDLQTKTPSVVILQGSNGEIAEVGEPFTINPNVRLGITNGDYFVE